MDQERVVNSRPDRVITKKIISRGDFTVVPYEDSRCKIKLSEISCMNETGPCEIEPESRIFNNDFDGNVLIGDADNFIDRDVDLILQQMCCNETCIAKIVYKDSNNKLVKEISCMIQLLEVMEEQLISDWGWQRLYENSIHHKERGVELVKEKRITDAFQRFSKSLKFIVAVEPIDPEVVDDEKVNEMIDLKVKLYNNMAYCQLHYKEYEAALELCNKSLKYQPDNVKALYRRCVAYQGMHQCEDAWKDIQLVLQLDPKDKAAIEKAKELQPILDNMNRYYNNMIKKMFD